MITHAELNDKILQAVALTIMEELGRDPVVIANVMTEFFQINCPKCVDLKYAVSKISEYSDREIN